MFHNVILGWLSRRALELGGIFGILWTIYTNLPPASQNALERLLTGRWQEVTLGAIAPLIMAVCGYVWSWRSTVRVQGGVSNVDTRAASGTDARAITAARTRTFWGRITGK